MECIQDQVVSKLDVDHVPRKRIAAKAKRVDIYDKKSGELRRHYASEKAIRELEQRRDLSLTVVQRMSFIR